MTHLPTFSLPVVERWSLPTQRLGRDVLVCDELDSTNARLLALAGQPGTDGLALLAHAQTAGRGQHGRSWLAAPRASVLLSLCLMPPPPLWRPAILTAWAAVAVCAVIRGLDGGLQPRIKWPNDVLVGGRKVCGILIETVQQPAGLAVVLGVGLNVRQTQADFDAAGLPEATSLHMLGIDTTTEAVAWALVARLDGDYERLRDGDHSALETAWRNGLGLLHQRVAVELRGREVVGTLTGLGLDGVVVSTESGDEVVLAPESVLHLRRT